MKIELLESEPAFLAIKDGWNELTREPFQSWEWNYWWWKHLGHDSQLRVITAVKNGKLCGIAPFIVTSRSGETCLRFIGSGKACTDHVQLIVAQDHTQEFCDAIANQTHLKHGFLSDVSLLEFEGVSPDSNSSTLCERLGNGFWSYRIDLESSWVAQLPSSWETFSAQRHKSLRRKIRKAENRYLTGQAVVKSTNAGLDFELAFNTLVDLHQKRFTSKGESGVFSEDRFTCFLRSAARDLAARGKAEIVIAEVRGEPIAAQLYLHGSRGPQMYQSGICDRSLKLDPGHLLFVHAIKSAIEDGCTEFDFLRGDDKYKHTWGGRQSPLCTIRCVSNRLPITLKHQVIRGLRHLNSWTKDSSFVSSS